VAPPAQAVDASANDGTSVIATGSQAGIGTFGDFFKTVRGKDRPRHLNFTVSLMVRAPFALFCLDESEQEGGGRKRQSL